MTEEGISQEIRLKKTKKINFVKEIDQNELLSYKNEKVCTTLNYIEHFLTLIFAVTVCISISAFVSLMSISKGIMISTIGLNICSKIARIKEYKSIIKIKRKYHEIALLAKTNLNCVKGLISRSLSDSCIERDDFHLIEVLKEYEHMKEKQHI